MPKVTLNNVTVFDAYMTLLADRGIDYWFANAGSDFAPVVETLAKAEILTKVPKPVTCPHENTAMHMAIGYFLVTGKPQPVMVHVNVGTASERHERSAQRSARSRAGFIHRRTHAEQ